MPTTKTSGSLDYKLIQKGVDDLYEMSGGRIEITLYPIKALVGTAEMLEALSDGHFETAQVFSSYFTGTDPGFAALASLSGLYKDAGEFTIWHDHFGGREITERAFAKYNVQYSGGGVNGAPEPFMSKKPIYTIADFQGLKLRTPSGLTHSLFAKLGAVPINLPGSEAYTALDTGVIDALERLGLTSNWDEGYHEITDYVLYPGFHAPGGMQHILINQDEWNKLPDDLKAIFKAFVTVTNRHFLYGILANETISLKKMIDYGLEWVQFSEADMAVIQEMGIEVAEEWATKSDLSMEVITSLFDWMEATGKM